MRWFYGLDLGNGLNDIGIGSVYQHDTLTILMNGLRADLPSIYHETVPE